MLTIPSLTLALLLSTPMPVAEKPTMEPSLKAPMIVFAVAASADWVSTHRLLSAGGREVNPALSWMGRRPTAVVAVGMASDVLGAWAIKKYIGRKHPKLAAAAFYGASAFRVFLAVRNEKKTRIQRTY